jgi:phosphoglycolate phosphatase
LARALTASGLTDYFHTTRTADKTVSKPHPAMLLEIMAELKTAPERTLMIGDTTHDLQMAINASVPAVAVTHGAHPLAQLAALKPLALVDSFIELRQWLKVNA